MCEKDIKTARTIKRMTEKTKEKRQRLIYESIYKSISLQILLCQSSLQRGKLFIFKPIKI